MSSDKQTQVSTQATTSTQASTHKPFETKLKVSYMTRETFAKRENEPTNRILVERTRQVDCSGECALDSVSTCVLDYFFK